MKPIIHRFILGCLVLGSVFWVSFQAWAAHESVLDRIKEADQPFDSMKIESAHDPAMKTVRAKEPYQGGTFRVLARKDSIERYRCSSCHTD
ncbi:MAG: hypothetical protein OEV64_15565, partial [Desulfobulbaceae bacterium]|nr:hypothetical protein [Desulfobulbaceae bacterium]